MPPITEPRSDEPQPPVAESSAAKRSAILLAGGRGSRLGGVEKALLRRGEQSQIQRWVQELQQRDIRTVVVGPASLRSQIPTAIPLVRESPPFAGPAAAVLAGAAELRRGSREAESGRDSDPDDGAGESLRGWTLLLAVDLTEPAPLLDWLLSEAARSGDARRSEAPRRTGALSASEPGAVHAAVLPCDESGRLQYLSAAVPTDWLLRRVGELTTGEVEDRPLRWLLNGLDDDVRLHRPVMPHGLSEDVDTLDDAERLGLRLP